MKKTLTILLTAIVAIAAIVAVYRFCFRKTTPTEPTSEQVVTILRQNDCFACHSAKAPLPPYASLPLIGPLVKGHIQQATDFVDLETPSYDVPSEVLLSMLEYSVTKGNMPLASYRAMHWGTGFTSKEKSILATWVRDMRAKHYATGLAATEFADEPIQVLPASLPVDTSKVALGEKMFNDTRISLDNTISCASCHVLAIGGADKADRRTSLGIDNQAGGINAPTVYNAAFCVRQFWNGRAADLKEQAAGPPENPIEMGAQTWAQIVERLKADKGLAAEFAALYPGEGLTQATVCDAIAEYEKTLLTPDSRFDKYLAGDKTAITDSERAGYDAFKRVGCATCHTGKAVGGQSFEKLAIFGDYFADREQRAPDVKYNADDDGLKGFSGNDADLHRYKTPTLRNVALTPPYFHDGTYNTLEEAVAAMYQYEIGTEPEGDDLNNIVAFLKTLTGKHPALK